MRFHPRSAIVTTLALTALALPLRAIAAPASDQAKPASAVTTSTSSSTQTHTAVSTTTTTTSTTTTYSSSTSSHSTSPPPAPPTSARHGNTARAHHALRDRHQHARARSLGVKPKAHSAADPGVTIANFAFSPAPVTIKVGDTITWTNNDAIAHTATASDGSFDTGTLQKGQSGSHTFTTAGTFAYICSIHPNMHGTVVVQGSSSGNSSNGNGNGSGAGSGSSGGSGSTPSGSSSATPAATAAATSSVPSLPNTGTDLGTTVLVGALMIGAGFAVRRRIRTR